MPIRHLLHQIQRKANYILTEVYDIRLKRLALTSCDLLCDHITSGNTLESPVFIENTSTSVKNTNGFSL